MNYKRIGRALICLVLVCALLVNVSPIKAEALDPVTTGISAILVVGFIMYGLGLGIAAPSTVNVFEDLVHDCISVIQSDYDFIDEEGLVEIYTDYSASTAQYYVNQAMVEAVREWMFESETVTGGDVAEEGYAYYNAVSLPAEPSDTLEDHSFCYIFFDGSYYYLRMCECPFFFDSSYGLFASETGCELLTYRSINGSDWRLQKSSTTGSVGTGGMLDLIIWSNFDICFSESAGGGVVIAGSQPSTTLPISVTEGLTAHQIAPKDEDFATGYPVWNAGIESFPKSWDQPEIVVGVPIGLASTLDGTFSLTQEDVQKGVSTLEQGGGDITDPDDGNNDDTGGLKLAEITVTAFVARLLADLTRAILGDRFTSLEDLWGSKWIEVQNSLGELQSAISQLLTQIETSIQNMTSSLSDVLSQTMTSMKTGFESLTQSLTSSLTDLKTSLQNLSQTLTQALEDLKNDILQGVKNLFVPEKDYLTSEVNALREEFVFADSIVRTGEALQLGLAGISTTPPVIYIHLGDTEGSYNIGGTVPFLDLRWYARYKPTVDTLISAFLWICFVWRMLVKLPGIISGMPGDFVMASAHQMGVTDYLPTRSKEYEIQRISNRETIRKGPGK